MERGAPLRVALLVLLLVSPAALAAKPKSSLAYQYYSRGVELNSRKHWDEALKQFQSAIDLNPSYVTAYVEYARAAVMLGKRGQGLDKLDAGFAAARTRDDKDRVQKERESLSEIFYTNETFQWYQNGLNFLKLDRAGSAVDALERARRTEPDNVLVLSAYARALRVEDRTKDAVPVLERALQLNEGKRDVRLDLADAVLVPNPERAHELLKGLGQDERAVILDAQALSSLKRNHEAVEAVRAYFEKQPSSLYAPFWLGKLYERETDGSWNARKYLMTFLRRADAQAQANKDESSAEARQLRTVRAEADQILARVNQKLE